MIKRFKFKDNSIIKEFKKSKSKENKNNKN